MPIISDHDTALLPESTPFAPFPPSDTPDAAQCLDLPNDVDPADVIPYFNAKALRIAFPSFADGRGFSLAAALRDLGYQGVLRAQGHVICEQYTYARRCGFDDVEISDDLLARQPREHWKATMDQPTYRDKLGQAPRFPAPANTFEETVTEVQHYTDRLFRFRITRPASFRFRSGEFVMIGLPNAERPVFRAYSVASPAWDETLEFYSIKVPDGPLTQHLQKIQVGDPILMRKKPTGTLVNDALLPAKRLWMMSTGTGIAPFASLIRDPDTYEKFDEVILCHTCREQGELAYGFELMDQAQNDPLVGEFAGPRLRHYATTTRDDYPQKGRLTDLINSGKLFEDLGVPRWTPETDRVMICGSAAMLADLKALCEAHGLEEGANNKPAQYVIEKAFVD